MAAMLKALTAAITAGFANASTTPTTAVVKKHSTSLDPYDTQGFDLDTKDGKYQWSIMTRMIGGWKLLPISVENADRLMDLFKDRKTQFGLDSICTVPTSGTGNSYPRPRTIAGVDYQNTDLKDHFELLKDIHMLTLNHVRAYSGWFMGGESSTLVTSTDMQIKAIDPNKIGNAGLVNQFKIRLRRLSGALHFILKNHVSRSSYNSFLPSLKICLYQDKVSGRKLICGLILLKMAMEVMKPQLVINHRQKEKALESLTLSNAENNVRTFLTKMQEQRDEIDTLRKDGVKYDAQRFLTLMFDKLLETSCPDFLSEVKLSRNQWVKNPAAIDENVLVAEFINLYTNFKSNGEWDKHVVNKDATIIALATALKAAKKATEPAPKLKGAPKSNDTGPPAWKFEKVGATTTCPDSGNIFKWCPHHGSIANGKGMYMPAYHDHDA